MGRTKWEQRFILRKDLELIQGFYDMEISRLCLLYTSDAADDLLCVDLGGRRIIKKKTTKNIVTPKEMFETISHR